MVVRRPKKEISKECRAQAVILRKEGLRYQDIAKKLGISYCAVCKAVKRHEELGSFTSKKRSGRPRLITPHDDRAIAKVVKKSLKASSLQVLIRLPVQLQKVSTRTIRRRLFESGLKSYTPARKPRLSKKNVQDQSGRGSQRLQHSDLACALQHRGVHGKKHH